MDRRWTCCSPWASLEPARKWPAPPRVTLRPARRPRLRSGSPVSGWALPAARDLLGAGWSRGRPDASPVCARAGEEAARECRAGGFLCDV
jgi:hypothetical protein